MEQQTSNAGIVNSEGAASPTKFDLPFLWDICAMPLLEKANNTLRGHLNQQSTEAKPLVGNTSSAASNTQGLGPTVCPYHGPILQLAASDSNPRQGLNPMERFLSSGPSEQPALLLRPDTGELSISKYCSCGN